MPRPDDLPIPAVGESLDGAVVILDPAAAALIDPAARLTRLTDGGVWAEGPVYLPDEDVLMYSDVRADRGVRWSEERGGVVWRVPNDHTNGNTLDREGRVVHCEHGNRRIARTEPDGTRHGLVDRFEGKRLNSPNDVVVKSDGTIWFTDPPYGIVLPDEGHPAPQEQPGCYVFRFDPESGRAVGRDRRHRPPQRPGLLAGRVTALRQRHQRRPRPGREPSHRRPRRRRRDVGWRTRASSRS